MARAAAMTGAPAGRMPDASAPAADVRVLTVPEGAAAQRVDRFVADVTGLSRSYVQRLISSGLLTADDSALKANAVVGPGATLRLVVPPAVPLEMEADAGIGVVVAYEDADVLVVDKPAGLVVHPSPGHPAGTLVNALLGRAGASEYGGIAGVQRPGIVHRLDRDTSGLLMVAKHDAAQASLMAQLKARRVKKTYIALVAGEVAAFADAIAAETLADSVTLGPAPAGEATTTASVQLEAGPATIALRPRATPG